MPRFKSIIIFIKVGIKINYKFSNAEGSDFWKCWLELVEKELICNFDPLLCFDGNTAVNTN